MCILDYIDLSKVLMTEFHYEYIKNNKTRPLFVDTDNLMYEIKTKAVYYDFWIDFNNYSAKSKFHDNLNTLVVSKIKDKTTGLPVKTFVGLMTKLYLYLFLCLALMIKFIFSIMGLIH